MPQNFKERWGIPIIQNVIGGVIVGIPFMVWAAWYSGVKLHAIFSVAWFKAVLTAPVQVWLVFILLTVGGFFVALYRRSLIALREERAQIALFIEEADTVKAQIETSRTEHAVEIKALKNNEPKLHGVWNNAQTFWAMGSKGNEPIMQIGGWINLTSSKTTAMIYVLNAYINGQRSEMFMPVEVRPNVVNERMLMLFMLPPLTTDLAEPFTATLVLEDQYNRKFEMPEHTFRATNRPVALPNAATAPNSAPRLHASWLGSSDWGWASSNFADEGMCVYLIRGEVTLLLTNATERVHIVGAEIQGAKSMGDFETFDLYPDHPRKHELKFYFQGVAPKGTDNYAPQILFVDIQGNRYPTEPHEFHPFPVIDRVNVERQGRL
jgi:hypothetical protein